MCIDCSQLVLVGYVSTATTASTGSSLSIATAEAGLLMIGVYCTYSYYYYYCCCCCYDIPY
jgi:hypothetical protein